MAKTYTEIKTEIANDITSKTAKKSITKTAVGGAIGDVLDYVNDKVDEYACLKEEKELFDPTKVEHVIINGVNGVTAASETYNTTDYIYVLKGLSYKIQITRFRKLLGYDTSKQPIADTYINANTTDYTYTPTENGYFRISYEKKYESELSIVSYTTQSTKKVEEGVDLNSTMKTSILNLDGVGSVLNGKKWVVVGDSFTNGGTYDDVIQSGRYVGKKALYHYLIGNRNNMDIVPMAEGGRTMTTPAEVSNHNCFSDVDSTKNYTLIPEDADYITIWLGINDSKTEAGEVSVGSTPLGTINDTTVNTFYGAWNVVLEYILVNHPYAHVGVIVTNGCTMHNGIDDYANAIKAVARKWGISYLDLNGDYTIPLMHRVNGKSEVCDRAVELRKSAFWVSSTNGHPNAHAQAYQSTFIEAWLRTL